jgi:nucleotide-binding universal stress UspA family protein
MKILIPTDGSAYSKNAAKVAARIAQAHDYHIIVLHVVDDKGMKRKTWRKEGADYIIEEICELLVENGCNQDQIEKITEDGNAAETIVEVARKKKVDKIVIGTQGRTGIKMILGSVTEKVLNLSEALVLVVPPNYTQL